MEEYSDCCSASRHHIFSDLCADCLEHCEFTTDEDDFDYEGDIEDLQG
jgi:hypothetical protein